MNQFPTLENALGDLQQLHRAAGVLGAINQFDRMPEDNHLEQTLRVERSGLSTGELPSGHTFALDLERLELRADEARIALNGLGQRGLLEAALNATGLAQDVPSFVAGLEAKGVRVEAADLLNDAPIQVDPTVATDYARVLWRVFTAISRFRARLTGPVTPVAVWPHGFDLSTLWFSTPTALESAPHMNYGFAPFDRSGSAPYLYAYAYPMPDGFEQLPLPEGAHWNTQGWSGMVVPYSQMVHTDDPEALIESTLEAVHGTLAPTLTP
jgi:Family of unknown function (DUF5996)